MPVTYEHFDKMFYTNSEVSYVLNEEELAMDQAWRQGRESRECCCQTRCVRSRLNLLGSSKSFRYSSGYRDLKGLGWKMHTAYGASKPCLESFSKTWAVELGHDYGITVNTVNPGPIATDIWE